MQHIFWESFPVVATAYATGAISRDSNEGPHDERHSLTGCLPSSAALVGCRCMVTTTKTACPPSAVADQLQCAYVVPTASVTPYAWSHTLQQVSRLG